MTYLAGLIIAGLFFLTLKYFLELSKKQEFIVFFIVAALIFAAIAYNSYTASQRDKMLSVVTKFQQNKSVTCKGKEVNATNYDLSIGTYTFIGRENTPNYGEMISASNCE